MQTLYFDCFAGASGNMILGALIAAGVDVSDLKASLETLGLPDFEIKVENVQRAGISSTHVSIEIPDEKNHRHLPEIEKIITGSALSNRVKDRSLKIFRRLAEAEAKVHGTDVDKVHFHEVGGLDAIVDIVGACIGFEMLGIERFVCSKIHVGSGFVKMQHGTYPVPPPAVANLLEGCPVYSTEIAGELITPTGAAIISTVCASYGALPEMVVEQTAYGAGTRTYEDFPNVLRLMIGKSVALTAARQPEPLTDDLIHEDLVLLETNVDDVSPQVVGFVLERALDIGALDCWITPIQMKKNRPGNLISVLCTMENEQNIRELIFTETTTLGVRSTPISRLSLPREVHAVETTFGTIDVKVAKYKGMTVNVMPEYEQVREVALRHGLPFRQVHNEVISRLKGHARSVGS